MSKEIDSKAIIEVLKGESERTDIITRLKRVFHIDPIQNHRCIR